MNTLKHLLPLLFLVLAIVSQGHAHYRLGKEKVAHLHFYYQENLKGDQPTAVLAAEPEGTVVNATNLSPFGAVYVEDTPLTEGQDPNSTVIGRAQGLVVSAGQAEIMFVFIADFEFTSGKFNGSSISILSRNPTMEINRELALVGGRGKFRMARGFANVHTSYSNLTAGISIYEYNVTVFYYG